MADVVPITAPGEQLPTPAEGEAWARAVLARPDDGPTAQVEVVDRQMLRALLDLVGDLRGEQTRRVDRARYGPDSTLGLVEHALTYAPTDVPIEDQIAATAAAIVEHLTEHGRLALHRADVTDPEVCRAAVTRLHEAIWAGPQLSRDIRGALGTLAGWIELADHLPDEDRARAVAVARALTGPGPVDTDRHADAARTVARIRAWADTATTLTDRFPGAYGAGRAATVQHVVELLDGGRRG